MEIESKAQFESLVSQYAAVLFLSPQQPQSQQMSAVLTMLSNDFQSKLQFFKVAIDNNAAKVAEDWAPVKITTAPLVVLFCKKVEVARIEGADPPRAVDLVERLCKGEFDAQVDAKNNNASTTDGLTTSQPVEKDAMMHRLERLVNSSAVMIFMKGSKHSPFCRFSKQAAAMLNSLGVDFGSFDVFADQTVREGMKVYSNWPTFPQLYVNGEFIGGVDIMNEMYEDGSLQKLLQQS